MNSNWSHSPKTLNLSKNRRFFSPCDLEIWQVILKNNRAPLLTHFKPCASFRMPLVNSNWSYSPESSDLGQYLQFLVPCDLQIWRMTLQNKRWTLLCYFKLCASFCSHMWIQTWVTVRKLLNLILPSSTLTFDLWPWLSYKDITFDSGNNSWKLYDDTMIGT